MGSLGENRIVKESRPMVSGDGPNSYAQNSTYQKQGAQATKNLISEGIKNFLDFKHPNFESLTTITIADLGCSTGPNTFFTVQHIIEATKEKYQSQIQTPSPSPLEFQVFFSDLTDNDFNTLFKTLSSYNKNYYFAGGVPGSFYNRLFPKSSIHHVNASYALHWISKIPNEILENPALNKESIYCSGSIKEVSKAYLDQFKNDIDSFLTARAEEIIGGGLMSILLGGRKDEVPMNQTRFGVMTHCLECCLSDMVKLGVIFEEKVNSFNLPLYFATSKEMEEIIERNGNFNIEKLEILRHELTGLGPEAAVAFLVSHTRGAYGGLLKEHFQIGENILDQIFEDYAKKIAAKLPLIAEFEKNNAELFVLLKRNLN